MDGPGWVGAHATCGHLLRFRVGVRVGVTVRVRVRVRVRDRVRADVRVRLTLNLIPTLTLTRPPAAARCGRH